MGVLRLLPRPPADLLADLAGSIGSFAAQNVSENAARFDYIGFLPFFFFNNTAEIRCFFQSQDRRSAAHRAAIELKRNNTHFIIFVRKRHGADRHGRSLPKA